VLRICIRLFRIILGKLDPDPHQSGKPDPDPHLSEKQDLDPGPYQSEKVKALEGHFGAL
jgi:hypothetical protein